VLRKKSACVGVLSIIIDFNSKFNFRKKTS